MQRQIARRSPALVRSACFAATALLAQPVQAADPPWWSDAYTGWGTAPHDPPPDEPTADHDEILEKSGAIMSGFAAGTLLGAALTLGVAEAAGRECGLTGCYTVPDRGARVAAIAMIAGGGAMGLVAVPCWLAGKSHKPWRRTSDRRMATGIVLTTVGTGSLVASAILLSALFRPEMVDFGAPRDRFNRHSVEGLFVPSIVQGATGLAMMVTGSALWGTGARTPRVHGWTGMHAELHLGLASTSLSMRF